MSRSSNNGQELDDWIMSCILSLLWVRPAPLARNLKHEILNPPSLNLASFIFPRLRDPKGNIFFN